MICNPMGRPALGKSTGNRDRWQSPHICRSCIVQQRKLPRTQQVWVHLQLGNSGCLNRRGGSYKNIHIFEHPRDFDTYLLQFAAPLLNLFAADPLARADTAEGFRLVQFRTSGNKLGVISV